MLTVTTFALVPGAGGTSWFWHRVAPLLAHAGHTALPIDLPGDDESAGLPEYAALVEAAIEPALERGEDVVVVAQSLGGFTAPVVASHRPVAAVVLVNAMIPLPGETPGAWWDAVGQDEARRAAAHAGGWSPEFDVDTYFLHDVDPRVAADAERYQRPEAAVVFDSGCAIDAWPDVPTRVAAGADDRFFPVEFQRRVAWERLGTDIDVVPGGHLAALSHPRELTAYLLGAQPPR